MSELIRCNACRGMKQVAKLGGMIGDCNTCNGLGKIKAVDKVATVSHVEQVATNEIKKAVATAIPFKSKDEEPVKEVEVKEEPKIKVDGKKAVFKRKKG